MTFFSTPTAYLMVSLLYMLMPYITWVVLSRRPSPAIALWCTGGIGMGVAFLLVGLRGKVPEWATWPLANLLIFNYILFRSQSLRLDQSRPWRTGGMVVAALAFIVVFEAIRLGLGNLLWLVQYNHAVYALGLTYLSILAYRIGRQEQSRSAYWIAHVYLLSAGAMLFQVLTNATGLTAPGDLNAITGSLIAFVGLLGAVVTHVGYIGLALERSRRETATVEEQSASRYQKILRTSNDGFWLVDAPTGRLLDVNDAASRLSGYAREELLGMHIHDLDIHHGPADVERHSAAIARQGWELFETQHKTRDNRIRDVEVSASFDPETQTFVAFLRDITERKAAAEMLRISEERHRFLAENALDVIWSMEIDGNISYISSSVEQLRGFTPEEARHQRLEEIHPPASQAVTLAYFRQLMADILERRPPQSYRGELEYLCKDGSTVWCDVMAYPLLQADGSFLQLLGVSRDISERKRYELELQQARDAADAANAAKSQFLAHMSHEIRTPMNGVLGMAQLLERESLTPDQLEMVQHIRASGKSLLSIINDILDFSKIEAGQLKIEQQPFDLTQTLTQIDSICRVAAEAKGIGLRVVAPGLSGHWLGDALRLEQVLFNLVGNAIKFTGHGGVTIQVAPVGSARPGGRLRFEIRDTGIGMPPEAVVQLFQPFTQADSSISRRFGGTGLGLAISKRLVELMGGEIGVSSTLGEGSLFWFELPLDRVDASNDVAADTGTGTPSAEGPAKQPRLTGLRVLIVDDSALNRFLAMRGLKLEGALTTEAPDGQQALDLLRAQPGAFDVVLMDIQMPVMDGLTATREIRRDPHLAGLPVVALTAGVLAEEREAALEAGVNDFLTKPLDLRQMNATLSGYLRQPDAPG